MEVYGDSRIKVEIDDYTQKNITYEFIRRMFDMPNSCYIDKKGNLVMTWEDGGGSHSWTEEKIIRKATKADKLYIEFMDVLHEKYYKRNDESE